MTWFKNSIKLLAVSGLVALATSLSKTYALPLSSITNAAECDNSLLSSAAYIRYENSRNSFYNAGSSRPVSLLNTKFVGNMRFNTSSCGSSDGNPNFALMKLDLNDSNVVISIPNNSNSAWIQNVIPQAGLLHTFKNGDSVLLDQIYFANGTFVLTNSDYSHTLQYIGNWILEDYIVYVNPLQSTVEAGVNNFYLISLPKRKAYSYLLIADNVETAFFGKFADGFLQSVPYDKSYTLSESSNTLLFPAINGTNSYFTAKNKFSNDTGFIYTEDNSFIAPDFGGGSSSDNDNQQFNEFNEYVVNGYNDCVNKGENLRKALHLAVMCRYQDTNTDRENIIYNTGLNYTGSASYCQQLDSFVVNLYNTYSGNWATGILDYDINLQDTSAPINELIFAWYYNSVVVDQSGNISGLPVGNNWCIKRSNDEFKNKEKTFVEKVSDSLTDFFGSGVAGTYIESVKDHASFSGLISSISEGSSGFFSTYLFDPYVSQFNSGSNAFYSKLSMNSCSDIKNTIGSYNRVDIILYSLSAILIFILIMLF